MCEKYNLETNIKTRKLSKPIKIDQHCFDRLSERKLCIKEIVKAYGPGSVVDYFGLTPQNKRDGNREKVQSDPKCRFLV